MFCLFANCSGIVGSVPFFFPSHIFVIGGIRSLYGGLLFRLFGTFIREFFAVASPKLSKAVAMRAEKAEFLFEITKFVKIKLETIPFLGSFLYSTIF